MVLTQIMWRRSTILQKQKKEAEKILAEAHAQAETILSQADQEAENIRENAKKYRISGGKTVPGE